MDAQDNVDMCLVSYVEMHKNLYDKTNKLYKDKYVTINTWKSTATKLNMNAEDCQRRWGVLRTRYNKEKRDAKNITSGSGASTPKKPWPLLRSTEFLEEYIKPRKSFGNILTPEVEETTEELLDSEFYSPVLSPTTGLFSQTEDFPASQTVEILEVIPTFEMKKRPRIIDQTSSGSCTPTTKISSKADVDQNLLEACGAFKDYISQKTNSQPSTQTDSDLNLCMTLYSKLKNLSNKTLKKNMRRQILNLLSEMESDDDE